MAHCLLSSRTKYQSRGAWHKTSSLGDTQLSRKSNLPISYSKGRTARRRTTRHLNTSLTLGPSGDKSIDKGFIYIFRRIKILTGVNCETFLDDALNESIAK